MYKPGELNRATFTPEQREELARHATDGTLFPPEEVVPEITLNEGQQKAGDTLIEFCLGKRGRKILLSGIAGTGKSTLLNWVVERVKAVRNIGFGMTAPTHKAVRVIRRLSKLKDKLDFGTIHSFLALKQDIDHNGVVSYKPDFSRQFERRIDSVSILIVDESSMLDDTLFGFLEDEMRSREDLRIIYTGDSGQIPPVGKKQKTGESNSIPFIPERRISHKIEMVELTEPQRQAANSPIIMYAHAIRQQHKSQSINFEFKDEYKHALEVVPRNWPILKPLLEQYFDTPEFQADPDYVKVIAWRNATVDYFNTEIRKIVYKRDVLPKIVAGEKLILDQPIVKGEKVVLANNEEVVVEAQVHNPDMVMQFKVPYKVMEFEFGNTTKVQKEFTFKVYGINLVTPEGFKHAAHILHEDSEENYKRIRETIAGCAKRATDQFDRRDMWKEFYRLESKFVWTKYNYAVTAHKSQGSTYQYCFSNEWDILQNKDFEERSRILYVAATRTASKLFIIK